MNYQTRIANYIARYAPSEKKIREYLTKKKCRDIDVFLSEIGYNESIMLDLWIGGYINSGKGRYEIQQKLMKKGFPKERILEKLEEREAEISDFSLALPHIEQEIQRQRSRNKSLRMIEMTLVGRYPYFRDEIRALLEGADDDTSALKKEIEKYIHTHTLYGIKEQQKLYAAMMRRGFRYQSIHEILHAQ